MSDELCFLTIADAARRLRARSLSAVELAQAHLDRIAALDAQVNAYITVTAGNAIAAARAADDELRRGNDRGPLHGIPYGLKDMIETRGVPTTAHSKVLAHHVPDTDAHVVTQLDAAGAVLLGKHALHEFAHGGPSFDLPWPPARNPWNTGHYTGSSSSGSAAAVAAGLATFALGTDTGGSVRTPAWMCGIVGFKPSFGVVGRGGVIPFSSSCDHVGPMTRTVEDAALVLQAIAGHDARDPGSSSRSVPDFSASLDRDLRGVRIGVLRQHFTEDTSAHPALVAALDAALDVLRSLGAMVEDVRLRSLHDLYAVRVMLTESELFARHQEHLRQHAAEYGDHFLGRTLAAALFSSADYLAAQRERRRLIAEMAPLNECYDAFVTTGAGPAPHLDSHRNIGAAQKWTTPSMGTLASVTGAPALALPCGFHDGLPLGLQLVGRPFDDAGLLGIGAAYERATGWSGRHPQLVPGAVVPIIDARGDHAPAIDVPPSLRATIDAAVRHAGLELDERALALLCESAPHAIALARRLPRDRPWSDEPAAIFTLDT